MLLLTLVLALASAAQSSPVRSIRDVDFKNFTYPRLPTGKCSMWHVRLNDGKYGSLKNFAPHIRPPGGCWQVTVGPIVYGDVTGDGQEDAMVVLYAEGGGNESSNDVFVYSLRNDRPKLLWKLTTGDRAEGGLINVYAYQGKLVLELAGKNKFVGTNYYRDDGTSGGGLCCPTVVTRSKYQWVRGKFRRYGRLEILPFKGWGAT